MKTMQTKHRDNLIVLDVRRDAGRGISASIARILAAWRRWQREKAGYRALASLTDRQLRDIGIPRESIREVVQQLVHGTPATDTIGARAAGDPGEGRYRKAA